MSEVVNALHQDGAAALPEAMETIRAYFDVDGVAIYQGEDLHRAFTAGRYINPIEKFAGIMDDSYLGLFDNQGVFKIGNIKKLKLIGRMPMSYTNFRRARSSYNTWHTMIGSQ